MAYSFPEGASFAYAPVSSFAAAKTDTGGATNASPCVVTSTAHGYSSGAILYVTSTGWPEMSDTIYKAGTVATDTVPLLGLDTTSTSIFPASGEGTISMQLIESSDWVTIPQVLTISTSGGDPRFTTISPLARRTAINVPTGFNPTTITLTMGYDADDATIILMQGISRVLSTVAFRMLLADGSVTYGYGYMAMSEVPSLNVNQANQVTAVFSLLGKAMSYSS